MRETLLPGAVLARVASSHIRVGTFQFFAARGDLESVKNLADHAIARHYPEAARAAQPYRAFLEAVMARQAKLVARWMLVGFIHGVMNTDNMLDRGRDDRLRPLRLHGCLRPATVFSSIDQIGRYAYANQPGIAQWNLARLIECLLPLLSDSDEDGAGPGQRDPGVLPARVPGRASGRPAAQARPRDRAGRAISRWRRICSTAWPPTRPISR